MTSSSNPPLERGLDTMVIVYSLLQGHPASTPCEQFIRGQTGWFTPTLTLFEAKAVLVKVYGINPRMASQKLTQFATGPIVVVEVDRATTLAALNLADTLGVDLTDAVLVQMVRQYGASWLATEDQCLSQVCAHLGITPQSPLDASLRQQIAVWESAHLSPKGLPRVLRQVQHWLSQTHPQAARDFWSRTAGGSHLP